MLKVIGKIKKKFFKKNNTGLPLLQFPKGCVIFHSRKIVTTCCRGKLPVRADKKNGSFLSAKPPAMVQKLYLGPMHLEHWSPPFTSDGFLRWSSCRKVKLRRPEAYLTKQSTPLTGLSLTTLPLALNYRTVVQRLSEGKGDPIPSYYTKLFQNN